MSEFFGGLDRSLTQEQARQMELLSERDVLEGMSKDELANYILREGERVSRIEGRMNLASEVLEGAYGVDIEQILKEREKQDGKK